MPSELTCLHCRRMLGVRSLPAVCPMCAKPFPSAGGYDPRAARMRGGMNARRDYDEDDDHEDDDDDDYED
jgi:hypothetical protein